MVKTSVELLSAHRLPPDSKLGRMHAAIEEATEQYRSVVARQNALRRDLETLQGQIAAATLDDTDVDEFSRWRAKAELTERALNALAPKVQRELNALNQKQSNFNIENQRYARLVRELNGLQRQDHDVHEFEGQRMGTAARARRLAAAARLAAAEDEDQERAAECERIRGEIHSLVE